MIRVFIDVTGGVVQKVVSDVPGIEVMTVDYDIHKNDKEECYMELIDEFHKKVGAGVEREVADFNPKFVEHYFEQADKDD
jgi:hypothetical protein